MSVTVREKTQLIHSTCSLFPLFHLNCLSFPLGLLLFHFICSLLQFLLFVSHLNPYLFLSYVSVEPLCHPISVRPLLQNKISFPCPPLCHLLLIPVPNVWKH